MVGFHAHAATLSITTQALRQVEFRIVSDGGGSNLVFEPSINQNPLNSCELCNRKRALARIVTTGIEEHHHRRPARKEVSEADLDAILVLEHHSMDRRHV